MSEDVEGKKNNEVSPKIDSIDVRKFILITPEIDRKAVFKLAEKFGFNVNNPTGKDTGLFTLDAFEVPQDQIDGKISLLDEVKDEIKRQEVTYYDDNKDKLTIDSEMLNLVAKFLTHSRREKAADLQKLQLVLSTIIGDLHNIQEENIRLVDPQTIEHLAKATVSGVLEETKSHLNQALVNTLIQIRKLAILWYFETISLNLYNLRTDKSETYKLQDNREVELDGKKYEVIKFRMQNRDYRVAYSELDCSLITFDVGKKNQDALIPLLSAFFIDKATLKWRLNYSRIIIKAISRLKDQMGHQIKNLLLEYENIPVEDLLSDERELNEGFEFLYQILFNYKNQTETENQSLKRHYKITYSRRVSVVLGGAISKAVRKVTPLELLEECEHLTDELSSTLKQVSDMKYNTLSVIKELIKAKKENNPSMFKQAILKLQQVGENITAKTLAELFEKMSKK